MTKEYISRDEMIEQTKARIVLGAPKFNTGLKAAIEVATSIPASDVVEVRHGRWQNSEDATCYQCSVCGKYRNQDYGLDAPIFDNFCPNCGAKMDGGQGDV